MENPGKVAGIVLTIIGVVLLIAGSLAYIWGIPESYLVDGGWFADDYYVWEMTYPFRELGFWLLGMGFIALILGIIVFVTQKDYQKQVVIEKVKLKCPYCGSFREEWQSKCPGCGAR